MYFKYLGSSLACVFMSLLHPRSDSRLLKGSLNSLDPKPGHGTQRVKRHDHDGKVE